MPLKPLFSRTHSIPAWVMGSVVLMLGGLACTLTWQQPEQSATLVAPMPTMIPLPAAPAGGWEIIAPGIERREMELPSASLGGQASVLRFDPNAVTFRIHYSAGAPRSLDEWRAELPEAAVIVNAGFFDETDRALGLVVVDGQSFGQTFTGFGGMFQVGWDGARVRSLVTEPYQGESVLQAAQSFPMLVETGGVRASQGDGFDQRSRRTVIAQDRAGRIVLIVVAYGIVSFSELQDWLLASDLDIQVALALDGGRSTGMDVTTGSHREVYPSWSRLPSVIAVYVP